MTDPHSLEIGKKYHRQVSNLHVQVRGYLPEFMYGARFCEGQGRSQEECNDRSSEVKHGKLEGGE
jgi:hypothetical protein